MGKVDIFSCALINHETQIVSPANGASYLLASSSVTGDDWPGHEDEIATWDDLFGWHFQPPVRGMRVYDELRGRSLVYTGTLWIKASTATVEGSGDQTLTGSFVVLTNWATPAVGEIDGPGGYGCFTFASGVLTAERDVNLIKIGCVVGVTQTASGSQNTFVARIEKSPIGGGGYAAIGPEIGGNTFTHTAMTMGSVHLCAEDYTALDGDLYRVTIKHLNGSGTLKCMGAGLHLYAKEIL
jgi:hypothetical protein